jgi:hypothetical protein
VCVTCGADSDCSGFICTAGQCTDRPVNFPQPAVGPAYFIQNELSEIYLTLSYGSQSCGEFIATTEHSTDPQTPLPKSASWLAGQTFGVENKGDGTFFITNATFFPTFPKLYVVRDPTHVWPNSAGLGVLTTAQSGNYNPITDSNAAWVYNNGTLSDPGKTMMVGLGSRDISTQPSGWKQNCCQNEICLFPQLLPYSATGYQSVLNRWTFIATSGFRRSRALGIEGGRFRVGKKSVIRKLLGLFGR